MTRFSRRAQLVAAVSVAALAAAGIAIAVTQSMYADSEGVLHGCVNKRSGALRVVMPGVACKATETALSWNQTGPQGEPGAAGAPGPAGPKGEQGPAGSSLASVDDLTGLPCQTLSGRNGETVVYTADVFASFFDPATPSLNPSRTVASGYAAQTALCVTPDGFEPNNDRAAATDQGTIRYANRATIYPAGESDWFTFQGATDRMYELITPGGTTPFNRHPTVSMDVYRDGVLVAEGVKAYEDPHRTPARWEFRIYGSEPAAYQMLNWTT